MVCSKCDKENKEGAIHCGGCGEKLFLSYTYHISKEVSEQNPSVIVQTSKNAAVETNTERSRCSKCGKENSFNIQNCTSCGFKIDSKAIDNRIQGLLDLLNDFENKTY
jgi:ribosomal protein L37E